MDFRAQWKGSVDFRTVPSILVYKMASQTLKWFKISAARAQIERPFSLQSGGRVEKMVDFCPFSRRLRSLFAPPGSLRSETVAGASIKTVILGIIPKCLNPAGLRL